MSVNVLYKTSAKATGGRDGTAATLDGALDVKLATPKELGGGGGATHALGKIILGSHRVAIRVAAVTTNLLLHTSFAPVESPAVPK